MYKLEWVDQKAIPDYISKFGDYNDFPPNWKQVTERELFTYGRMVYPPEYQEFRQMFRMSSEAVPMVAATLYFLPDGTGYAIEKDHLNWHFNYYIFAICEHEYKCTNKKGLEHTYTCAKCGHTVVCDSSDCHSYS